MSENRRDRDRTAAPVKGPIDRLGDALKADGTQVEIPDIRQSDLEPYVGLRYLSKLFKLMAVILVLLLVAEVLTGLRTLGTAALPTLLGESSRLIVLAGLLWGVGDLAILVIDVGHDVRAGRILLARMNHTLGGATPARRVDPANGSTVPLGAPTAGPGSSP